MISKIKEFLKYLWSQKVLIAAVMVLTGVLDLIGLTSKSEIGLGFILGFLLFFVMGIVKIAGKSKPKVG